MQSRKDLIELALLLGRETKANVSDAMKMLRNAKRWNSLVTEECNRELTAKEHATKLRVRDALRIQARDIGATGVILSGDPRGCVVKLTVKSKASNDFGGEGICIL